MKIVECVPNFSEGKDLNIIKAITQVIEETEGVTLLDVDPGADTNRTVVTFVGEPEAVKEGAFRAIKRASELIDMRKHKGAHPRMGATDVCPFVPVSGITMEECARLAHELGKRVGEELGIPVYMYEYAATSEERRSLANIRVGEYEGLPEKLKDPNWKPDYGPCEFNAKAGATVIGAREFLIAYNVNLNTRDRKLAHKIAKTIREKGYKKKDEHGNKIQVPGTLKAVRAVGWYIDEYGFAQVSMNLVNYKITPPHVAFEECRRVANELGLRVLGSELVGLIPKEPMLMAGRYYLEKQGKCPGVPEEELIHIAVLSMGLDQLGPFNPSEKIIEYRLEDKGSKLVYMTVRGFANELSTDSPAPGGGSVAALCGALSASLSSMVANLTVGKKKYEDVRDEMKDVALKAQTLKDEFLALIDKDTDAFNAVMSAMRMKKKTEEEKAARESAIQEATKQATLVPLEVLRKTKDVLELAEVVAERGNQSSVSDAGVSAIMAESAAESAFYNVRINLPGITDEGFNNKVLKEAEEILKEVREKASSIKGGVEEKI